MTAAHVDPAPGTQHPRRRRQVDWELITCGVRGHVLVGRDVEQARPQDAVLIRDDGDLRWHRCLRCDCWVVLPRPAAAPRPVLPDRAEITVPIRARALHDRIVLRLIALDRAIHFLVLGLLGLAVLLFASDRASLRAGFYRVLTALQGGVAGGPIQTTGRVGIIHELDRLFTLQTGTLQAVGVALLAYALLEGVEGIGLWLGKRWAEYLTFVSTGILLPFEIYEIINRGTVLKVIGFLINLAVVVYLLLRKRLFGLRGGAAADEAERERDGGWPAVDRATPSSPAPPVQPVPPVPPAEPVSR
jgi:uncharacterized membrane protein (DUF2068 family)